MKQLNKEQRSSSRQRLEQLKQQQKHIYNEFRINNFYVQKKLDLVKLKDKIQEIKGRQSASRQRKYQSISVSVEDNSQTILPRPSLKKQPQNIITQINPQTFNCLRQNRIKTQSKHYENIIQSKHLKTEKQSIYQNQIQKIIKITIETIEALQLFEDHIIKMWNLYQLLSTIMQGVQQFPFLEESSINKYVDYVCSQDYNFILDFLQRLNPRYRRIILASRLLEHLGIFYLVINLSRKKKIKQTYLSNLIGFACSNIIFLIRLYTLHYELKIEPSSFALSILATIQKFEIDSYKQIIISKSQVIIRMEHNNQTIIILQNRLRPTINKQCESFIDEFLKYRQSTEISLVNHSKYVFQFLAYHLNRVDNIGMFNYLEMAPAPYLQLKFIKTVIIEPFKVLFYSKNSKIYIRAHTQVFIEQLSKFCNVVLWSDMMPIDIDPLLGLLPKRSNIYYLYKYHCKHQNGVSVKILQRVGCSMDNVIIIDRHKSNYKYNEQIGVEMQWKGQKKDKRLLQLLDLIMPLFDNNKIVRKQIAEIAQNLENLKKKPKFLSRKKYYRKQI